MSKNLSRSVLFLALFVVSFAGSKSAHARLFADEGNPRCGLGTMILGASPKSIYTTFTEDSLNMFMGIQTWAITTGTSGCSNNGIVFVKPHERYYVNANFEELKNEMAEGHGEVLEAFAQTLGCSAGSVPEFARMVKEQYPSMQQGGESNPDDLLIRVKTAIGRDANLATGCFSVTI